MVNCGRRLGPRRPPAPRRSGPRGRRSCPVARRSPMRRSPAPVRLELKPCRHTTMISKSTPVASGMRNSDVGSRRRSSKLRSTSSPLGSSPCSAADPRLGVDEQREAAERARLLASPCTPRQPMDAVAGLVPAGVRPTHRQRQPRRHRGGQPRTTKVYDKASGVQIYIVDRTARGWWLFSLVALAHGTNLK